MPAADESRIDDAISNHLGTWWTDKAKHEIVVMYGGGTLNQVISICDFAEQSEIWLSLELSEAYNQTLERLKKQYPFLSDESLRKVANMAAYSWR